MEMFCAGRGSAVLEWISEVGGGMNFGRRKFVRLLEQVIAGDVAMIVVAHRDRLALFGFELIEWLANKLGRDRGGQSGIAVPAAGTGRRSIGPRARLLVPVVWVAPI